MVVTAAGTRVVAHGKMVMGAGEGQPVTLVCTDVEGSTELWEWDKEAMDAAQGLHDKLMRSQLSHFCGYEVGVLAA